MNQSSAFSNITDDIESTVSPSLPPFLIFIYSQEQYRVWTAYHKVMLSKNFYLHIFALIIGCTNILTNLFSYFVFSRFRTSTLLHRLLKYLSLCEVAFQVLFLVFTIVEERLLSGTLVFRRLLLLQIVTRFYLFVIIPALTASHITRNWIICIVSMYRFEVVCRALAQNFLLFRRPQNLIKIVLFVVCVSLAVSIPRSIERNTFVCPRNNVNSSKSVEEDTEFIVLAFGGRASINRVYRITYTLVLLFILQTGGPTICVCSLNLCLVVKLINRAKMQKFLHGGGHYRTSGGIDKPDNQAKKTAPTVVVSSRQNTASRGGRLVIVLSVCFFVFEMPSFLSKSLGASKLLSNSSSELLANVANFATALDSSINIFVYLFSNREFRRELCSILGLRKCVDTEPAGLPRPAVSACRDSQPCESLIPLRQFTRSNTKIDCNDTGATLLIQELND